jgi:hypothetical protein
MSIIITAAISILGTLYAPKLIARYNAYRTQIKHKRQQALRDMIQEEIKNVLLELKNEK